MMGSGLTARQAAFCEAFVLGGSAAAAARAAGYSPNSARTQAWRLLQQPAVQRRLQELRYSAQAGETAFAARLMARAERLWDAAQAEENHGLALRALQMQFRIAGRYGAPPTALVMGDEATLNDLTLTALVAETRRIELPAPVHIGPDLRAAAVPPPPPVGEGWGGGARAGTAGRAPDVPAAPPPGADAPTSPLLRQAQDEGGGGEISAGRGRAPDVSSPEHGVETCRSGASPRPAAEGAAACLHPRASVNIPADASLLARPAGPGFRPDRPPGPHVPPA